MESSLSGSCSVSTTTNTPLKPVTLIDSSSAPPLPHMTLNITTLGSILRKFTEDTYIKLKHIIETGPTTEAKKKLLLQSLVRFREDTVRLYVLTKWSSNSAAEEFGTLIDLLAWMRGQTENFQALIWHIMTLNQGLLSAKLPNPDLITALEVLYNGKPTLPTHGLLTGHIDPEVALNSLRELNVVCKVKFALLKDLPVQYRGNNYRLSDGRITITTRDYQFVISALNEDAPFIMLDFQFVRNEDEEDGSSENPLTNERTSGDAILNELHTSSANSKSTKLIKTCNEILKQSNFQELHRVLTNYTNTMKLYLLHCKLRDLKQIRHSYHPDRFQIVVSYWINSQVFRNSYLEIGLISKTNDICYKWYKQGQFVESFQNVKHIELLLREIYYRHSQEALSMIEDLSINNKSVLQINEQTGLFYFKNPTPTLNAALSRLNTDDFANINANLRDIRINLRFQEVAMVLKITGWKVNEIVRLSPTDMKRISSKFIDSFDINQHQNMKNWKFYTRDEWPSDWCLVLHLDLKIRAYIANIPTVNLVAPSVVGTSTIAGGSSAVPGSSGNFINSNNSQGGSVSNSGFKLVSFEELNLDTFDYKSSKTILVQLTKKIMTQLITNELEQENVIYEAIEQHNMILIKSDSFIPSIDPINSNATDGSSSSTKIGCTSLVYLHFASTPDSQETIDLTFQGKLRSVSNISYLSDFNVAPSGIFTFKEQVQFRAKPKNSTDGQTGSVLLKGVKNKLSKLMKTLELISFLEAQDLILKDVKSEKLIFSYGIKEEDKQSCIAILSGSSMQSLSIPEVSPHHFIPLESSLCLDQSNYISKNKKLTKLSQLIEYLKQSTTLVTFLSKLHSESIQKQKEQDIDLTDPSKLKYSLTQPFFKVNFKSVEKFSILYYQTSSSQPTCEIVIMLIQDRKTLKIKYLLKVDIKNSIKEDQLKPLLGKEGTLAKEMGSVTAYVRWFKESVVVDGSGEIIVKLIKYLHSKVMAV